MKRFRIALENTEQIDGYNVSPIDRWVNSRRPDPIDRAIEVSEEVTTPINAAAYVSMLLRKRPRFGWEAIHQLNNGIVLDLFGPETLVPSKLRHALAEPPIYISEQGGWIGANQARWESTRSHEWRCWAQRGSPLSAHCGVKVQSDDPLGLCGRHRNSIVGSPELPKNSSLRQLTLPQSELVLEQAFEALAG